MEERILEMLKEHGRLTASQIAEGIGTSRQAVNRRLRKLLIDKKVDVEKYSDKVILWKLKGVK